MLKKLYMNLMQWFTYRFSKQHIGRKNARPITAVKNIVRTVEQKRQDKYESTKRWKDGAIKQAQRNFAFYVFLGAEKYSHKWQSDLGIDNIHNVNLIENISTHDLEELYAEIEFYWRIGKQKTRELDMGISVAHKTPFKSKLL
tara:strand:- start:130 stop:558 length:429 start_codon:yes stop_codon:yes gene_type:complete